MTTPAVEFDRRIEALSDERVWGEYYEPETPARRRRRDLLRAALAPRQEERILDVGCGAGGLAWWAARRGARVIGLDYSHASLVAAGRVAAVHGPPSPAYLRSDATALPAKTRSFDKVVCVDVLDMLPSGSHAALLGELLRVVRLGGTVFLYTPNGRREALGRAIRPLRRLLGTWRTPERTLHIGLTGPSRVRRMLRALDATATLRFADMNYPWTARIPGVRAWLAGHMLWTIRRKETVAR